MQHRSVVTAIVSVAALGLLAQRCRRSAPEPEPPSHPSYTNELPSDVPMRLITDPVPAHPADTGANPGTNSGLTNPPRDPLAPLIALPLDGGSSARPLVIPDGTAH